MQKDRQSAPEPSAHPVEAGGEPPEARRRIPPSLAARYADLQVAGEGAMGTVYRAMDPQLGRPVALKLLKSSDPAICRRFIAEARAQARIHHEHVCSVYEAGLADGEPYIVMQYIQGEPLSRLREYLTLEQQVKLLQEVALAVHEAHRQGLIHRDLKPGNILVEQREDGTWKPYVVDFGLARQVAEQGQTQTGEVLGTPAYMSPEQVKGDVRKLDRRSDVYSLGATLYDVIAGRPPFVSEQPWELLLMAVTEDPPPLGQVKPDVPKNLETIVMKCLERKPARRYDSARALADELQRVLDGEPLQARPPSWGYRLWRKALRHKLLTVGLAALAVGALGAGAVWVGARRQAARQARLAQELGENVKEMELFLRAAYGLPLHDVERERDVVRARLQDIERTMQASGEAGVGPGHSALGLGQLALGEPARAREHLEQALAAGYSSAGLEYALGRALGELYRQALEETRRTTPPQERPRKVALLDAQLREPALRHLRAAMGTRLEAPEYVEGLIALYEGHHEVAIAKAREAFGKVPWMYEPKKLEGDALYAEGSRYRHDAAFDYEKMKGYFARAEQAYREAAEMGRSDPDIHRAQCELWEKQGWADFSQGVPAGPSFEAAEAACHRAMRASSREGGARVQQALVLLAQVYGGTDGPEEALPRIEEALAAAEAGRKARPQDVMAHYAVAQALYLRAQHLEAAGREASMEPAIAAYQQVLSLAPGFTWAHNELGEAYFHEARRALAKGGAAGPLLDKAVQHYEQALTLDPAFALPVGGLLDAAAVRLEAEISHGREAPEALQALDSALSRLEQGGSTPWTVALWKARAHRLRAHHELALGRDAHPPLEAAFEVIRAAVGESPRDAWMLAELLLGRVLEAENARRQGRDPAPALEKARALARTLGEVDRPRAVKTCHAALQVSPLLTQECQRLSPPPSKSNKR
jgi:serine/threonine-protein kinase